MCILGYQTIDFDDRHTNHQVIPSLGPKAILRTQNTPLLVLLDDPHQRLLVLSGGLALHRPSKRIAIQYLVLVLDGIETRAVPVITDKAVNPVDRISGNTKKNDKQTHILSSFVPIPAIAAWSNSQSRTTPSPSASTPRAMKNSASHIWPENSDLILWNWKSETVVFQGEMERTFEKEKLDDERGMLEQ